MRIVTLDAVTNRRRMHVPLNLRGIFVAVAGKAELVGGRGDQLYVRDIPVDPDFVAAHATHRHGRMHCFALRLILVASDAGGRVSFGVERYGVLGREGSGDGKN